MKVNIVQGAFTCEKTENLPKFFHIELLFICGDCRQRWQKLFVVKKKKTSIRLGGFLALAADLLVHNNMPQRLQKILSDRKIIFLLL